MIWMIRYKIIKISLIIKIKNDNMNRTKNKINIQNRR